MASVRRRPTAPLLVINPRASRSANRSGDGRWSRSSSGRPEADGRELAVVDDTQDAAGSCSRGSRRPPWSRSSVGTGRSRRGGIPRPAADPDGDFRQDRERAAASLGIRAAIRGAAVETGGLTDDRPGCRGVGAAGRDARRWSSAFVVAAGRPGRADHGRGSRGLEATPALCSAYVGATLTRDRPFGAATSSSPPTERRSSGAVTLCGRRHRGQSSRAVGPRLPIDPSDGRLDLLVVGGRGIPGGLRSAADLVLRSGELMELIHPVEGARCASSRPAATGRNRRRRASPGRSPHGSARVACRSSSLEVTRLPDAPHRRGAADVP